MAKLTLLLATFAVLLLFANASIYRTTIEIDDENPQRPQSCRQQFEQQEQLSHCQRFMEEQSRRPRLAVGNPEEEHLRQCCKQLEQMETRCRCEGLQEAAQRQKQQGQYQEGREIMETARNIPSMCRLQPMRCDFRSSWWF